MLQIPIALALLVSYTPADVEEAKGRVKRLEEEEQLQLQVNKIVEQSLEAAKKGDWELACNKFNERTLMRQKHKLDIFEPIPSNFNEKDAQIIHRKNKLIAEANSLTNRNAEMLCGKAGMKAVLNTAKAVYIMPTSSPRIDNQILSKCREEWGNDYVMIKHCVNQQTKAKEELGL